ncbi:MAG: hypothetical protein Q8T08_07395 [Ignavibacteria bacterium]|nr:hypothetical protein [Ignavibacteria bacterium]
MDADMKTVLNAVTLSLSKGVVEVNVEYINIKQQVYGKASFELLKRIVVL